MTFLVAVSFAVLLTAVPFTRYRKVGTYQGKQSLITFDPGIGNTSKYQV